MPARKPAAEPVSDIGTEEINTVTLPVRKSMVPELYRFVRSLAPDHPYHELAAAAQSAGWVWKMTETSSFSPNPGFVMVRFDVEIGKATNDLELEFFDTITMMVPQEVPSPSLFARINAAATLIYMVFGRLPPMPQQTPVPQPQPQPVAEPQPAPEPVEEEVPWQPARPMPPKPFTAEDMVKRHTPDGLPVMADPYTIEYRPEEIIPVILQVFEDAADKAESKAALTALWNKNQGSVDFVTDFASQAQKETLRTLFKSRAMRLD